MEFNQLGSNVKKMLHETVLPKLKLLQSQFKDMGVIVRELQQQQQAQLRNTDLLKIRLDQAEDTIDSLVNELSRYKNDSNELLMSVYAFCKVNKVNFYTNELSVFGYDLTRISKARGFHMETTYDSRYGTVGLYDQQLMCEYFNLETTDGATNV
jgi:hypothetical protein